METGDSPESLNHRSGSTRNNGQIISTEDKNCSTKAESQCCCCCCCCCFHNGASTGSGEANKPRTSKKLSSRGQQLGELANKRGKDHQLPIINRTNDLQWQCHRVGLSSGRLTSDSSGSTVGALQSDRAAQCKIQDEARQGKRRKGLTQPRPTTSHWPLAAGGCFQETAAAAAAASRKRSAGGSHHFKVLVVLLSFLSFIQLVCLLAEAGFWTFYFPNLLKPSGFRELTDMIHRLEVDMNATKDNFADIQHFWGIMEQANIGKQSLTEGIYPEESACSELFPLFRNMAIEYTYIDYDFYMKPMVKFHEHLIESRSQWYPEGSKSKTILPREWEQKLYETELEFKMRWHRELTYDSEYKKKREKMVKTWKSAKRSLDTSLACIHLKYAYRQIAEDINQLALEMNFDRMSKAMEMLRAAYRRIKRFEKSDQSARLSIEEAIKMEERLEIKSTR